MARDEVDISLITSEPRKRKLTAYITNEDNISVDKEQTVRQLRETINPTATATGSVSSS
jgi:hypothetical protein